MVQLDSVIKLNEFIELRTYVVGGEDNAPTLWRFVPCGGPVSMWALWGIILKRF
ncbi:hypothetical protein Hanom_Chr03g00197591 [Helianthus anomalus]